MNNEKLVKKYKHQILEYYAASKVNVPFKLDYIKSDGNLFIYKIKYVPGTTENGIRKYLDEVRQTLDLQLFQLHRDNSGLYFVAVKQKAFDNRLMLVLKNPHYQEHTKNMQIPFTVGFNVLGHPVIVDLATYVHWLIGGEGKSGKTVNIQSLITGIIWSCSPEDVNLIIFDGASNLTKFDGLPHLSCPIIQDVETGFPSALKLYKEMERRLVIKDNNIEELNRLPYIICIFDEAVAFIPAIGNICATKKLPNIISSLLRKGRHAKIRIILATQNPKIENLKCDLSTTDTRLAFSCVAPNFSVTILGQGGAEKLSGKGEMYFRSKDHTGLQYLKGAYITSEEITSVCNFICSTYDSGTPDEKRWDDNHKFTIDTENLRQTATDADDGLIGCFVVTEQDVENKIFAEIVMWSLEREKVSAQKIKDNFNLGWPRANDFLEKLYKHSIVGTANGKLARKVQPSSYGDLSEEIISFLNRHGYTADDIRGAFGAKCLSEQAVDIMPFDESLILELPQTEEETFIEEAAITGNAVECTDISTSLAAMYTFDESQKISNSSDVFSLMTIFNDQAKCYYDSLKLHFLILYDNEKMRLISLLRETSEVLTEVIRSLEDNINRKPFEERR